ncbi:type I polyketide synthase, partial [Mesorhizobium sp. M0772]
MAVQTFCSTSLVAVHLACQSLLTMECDLALAGGVAVQVPQGRGYRFQEGGILSRDGHCRTFDARAGGSVMGSGVGLVVLKRLDEALADGDLVRAVIRGSAVNNDGATRAGYTAPSVDGQAAVIAEALANAGVPAHSIGYLEAHGTATPLGDAVELAATIKAFGGRQERRGWCAIGSLKPNVGHLDRAAGIAGLIKVVEALQHRQLPPQIDYEVPSEAVDLSASPFYVTREARPWPAGEAPRRAGVSSFGLGGTNAHVVLEEAPPQLASPPARPHELVLLSAKTPAALERATTRLAQHLEATPELNLGDVAFTLQAGRRAFNHRRMVVAHNPADAAAALSGPDRSRVFTLEQARRGRPVAFMFPGLGDHYPGMAGDLYRSEPAFRTPFDRCADIISANTGE